MPTNTVGLCFWALGHDFMYVRGPGRAGIGGLKSFAVCCWRYAVPGLKKAGLLVRSGEWGCK